MIKTGGKKRLNIYSTSVLQFFYSFKLIITLGYKFCLHISYVKPEDLCVCLYSSNYKYIYFCLMVNNSHYVINTDIRHFKKWRCE